MRFKPKNVPLVIMCLLLAVLIVSFHNRAWIVLVLSIFAMTILCGMWVCKAVDHAWKDDKKEQIEDEKQGKDKE